MSSLETDPLNRLSYLLKHAWDRLGGLTSQALEQYDIDGRQLAVLVTLADGETASQQDAAQRLGVDRTTMVALLDTLETKGLVRRHPDSSDRRRNLVELTTTGRETLRRAAKAAAEAERQFLAPLTPAAAERMKDALRALIAPR